MSSYDYFDFEKVIGILIIVYVTGTRNPNSFCQ
jgi:hypothetical protein